MERKPIFQSIGDFYQISLLPKIGLGRTAPVVEGFTSPACFLKLRPSEIPHTFKTQYFRQNIAEGRQGIGITYRFRVVDHHGSPIPNAFVDIWQCDNEGVYSAFSSRELAGQSVLRGSQFTDVQGICEFYAIYPGWYQNRITHINLKVRFVNHTSLATSLYFPQLVNQLVYASPSYPKGQNPASLVQDQELKGNSSEYQNLKMNLSGDINQGFVATYTLGVHASAASIQKNERETQGQFWSQLMPGPTSGEVALRLSLVQPSAVSLVVFDFSGKAILHVLLGRKLDSGIHDLPVVSPDNQRGLPPGQYLFSLTIQNKAGTFSQARVMQVEA